MASEGLQAQVTIFPVIQRFCFCFVLGRVDPIDCGSRAVVARLA